MVHRFLQFTLFAAVDAAFAASTPVDFARDIQPLFAEHCVRCHGPDKQKNGLRLDVREHAMKGGDDGVSIKPGHSEDSGLVHLIEGREAKKIMPPKEPRLSAEQITLLRRWIDEGAKWPDNDKAQRVRSTHWALQPLKMPTVPKSSAGSEIDSFVQAKLSSAGMTTSKPADRAVLIRRLTFDLIGLPPTPAEIDAFVADASPRAYETLVERLLASPHYGERWGRHWLDVARYTESNGFEYDRLRENAWHYRDYVIKSFNDDKPYDRFMKEQIAGDAMEPLTDDGIIAPSLLVCGAYDQAGNAQKNPTQRKITREDELEDIIGVVGQSFLGLTINCARCHSHKFDPIPQEEYYRIKSVFEGVKHGERPLIGSTSPVGQDHIAALQRKQAEAQTKITALEAEGLKRAIAARPATAKTETGPAAFAVWSFQGSPKLIMPGEVKGGAQITGDQLVLPSPGAYFQTKPLPKDIHEKTLEVWVALADLKQTGGAAISLESSDGRTFDAITFGERQPRKWTAGSDGFGRTRDLDGPEETSAAGAMIHMVIVYRADNSISIFRNGITYGKTYTPARPLQVFKAGDAHIALGRRHKGGGNPWLTGAVRQAALYDRALSDAEVAASFRAAGLGISQSEVLELLSDSERADHAAALAALTKTRDALSALDVGKNKNITYAGVRVQPEPTRFLPRGDVNAPQQIVAPGALSAMLELESDFGLPADAPEAKRRLKFAEWVADARNPLPARVMANRVWHLHFGQGLVTTPNDFGVSGAKPSHPELLDWLAAKFIASGWSVKALHRLIVNSATYQQSSASNAKGAASDADNQMLWRFSPKRLEAEAVRDAMLAVSGQLNPAVGGRGFRPFTITEFNAAFYHLEDRDGPEFNRRTVYRVNVHSGKDPLLDAFDCPDPSVKTPRRGVTTTPLQALELMNNSFVQRQAKQLAERAAQGTGSDLQTAITNAYRLALGRSPAAEEMQRAKSAATERDLASVCWALLNSTEFVYVR